MTMVKKKRLYLIIAGMILVVAMLLSACVSKPSTIEELISSNKDVEEQVKSAAENAGMTVDIKGNEIVYSYDLSGIEGVTEETLKEEAMIKSLQSSLDSQKSAFGKVCKTIEEKSGISGVSATVNYTYGDEVLVTGTYTAADA